MLCYNKNTYKKGLWIIYRYRFVTNTVKKKNIHDIQSGIVRMCNNKFVDIKTISKYRLFIRYIYVPVLLLSKHPAQTSLLKTIKWINKIL